MDEVELKNKIKLLDKEQIWEVVEECIDQSVKSNTYLMEQVYENAKKETLSTDYVCGSALKVVAKRIKSMLEEYPCIKHIICDNGLIYQTDIDATTGQRYIKEIYNFENKDEKTLQYLNAMSSNASSCQRDIKTLKKMIKHCKNPMEKKSLEKELNEAYKRRKIK